MTQKHILHPYGGARTVLLYIFKAMSTIPEVFDERIRAVGQLLVAANGGLSVFKASGPDTATSRLKTEVRWCSDRVHLIYCVGSLESIQNFCNLLTLYNQRFCVGAKLFPLALNLESTRKIRRFFV